MKRSQGILSSRERPEAWVTGRTGGIGNTFRPRAGGVYGVEDLWYADFKREFKLGNGHYCYPLTVTDRASC